MKTDRRRRQIAEDIHKLSEAATLLASRIRWACRDVTTYLPRDGDSLAEHLAHRLFTLAQDVASGRVELDGPDSPRPLFDRPSEVRASFEPEPEPEPARTPAPPAPDPVALTPAESEIVEALTEFRDGLRSLPDTDPDDFRSQPGDEFFRCNRCNAPRRREIALCPACGCPEFRLVIADADGRLVKDLEALARLKAPPRRAAKKRKEVANVQD